MIIARYILLFAVLSCLAGCPIPTHGMSRSYFAEKTKPSFECVKRELMAIDGVSSVRYEVETGGIPITLHGLEEPDQTHRFSYTYKGISNSNFWFRVNYLGDTEYVHIASTQNKEAAVSLVQHLRPIILKMENALESRCGFPGIVEKANESCDDGICE